MLEEEHLDNMQNLFPVEHYDLVKLVTHALASFLVPIKARKGSAIPSIPLEKNFAR